MCLAVPCKIISVDGDSAMVDACGARREISLILLPDKAETGEYVLVHAGFAIQKINAEAAEETERLFDEIAKEYRFR